MRTITSPAPENGRLSLTDAVLEYQRSGAGFAPLIERLASIVYRFPTTRRGADEDDCGEFYCHFMPRVPRLIRRFVYQGKPFEVYLVTSMKWQYRNYIAARVNRSIAYRTIEQAGFWGAETPYSLPEAVSETPTIAPRTKKLLRIDDDGVIRDPSMARRLLVVAMKASNTLDYRRVHQVATLVGADAEWLDTRVAAVNALLVKREDRRAMHRRRRDQAFFRMQYFQEQLVDETSESKKARFEELLRHEQKHYDRARKSLARISVRPTHRDIAAVLGIPKGSVDSALYYANHNWVPAGESIAPFGKN
jgi:hypothetical protein